MTKKFSSPETKNNHSSDKFGNFIATHKFNTAAMAVLAAGLALSACDVAPDGQDAENSPSVPAAVRANAAQIDSEFHDFSRVDGLKRSDVLTLPRVNGTITIPVRGEAPVVLDHPLMLDTSSNGDIAGHWVGSWQLDPGVEGKGARIVLTPTFVSEHAGIMVPVGGDAVVEDSLYMVKLGSYDARPADEAQEQLILGNPTDPQNSYRVFPPVG